MPIEAPVLPCVSITVEMASNLGFRCIVLSDGTATFARTSPAGVIAAAELVHELALTSLHQEFATVMTIESMLKDVF